MSLVRLALFATVIGCNQDDAPVPKPGGEDTGADTSVDTDVPISTLLDFGGFTPRNIVVVHVDTLRADSLPQWGSERNTMPLLLQRSGWVQMEHMVSTASWTAPSTASLLTSAHQHDHGVRITPEDGVESPLSVPSQITHLGELGVATGLFTGSHVVSNPVWDLAQGFDMINVNDTEPGNAASVVADAVDWVDTLGPEDRFLVFLQPMDMHGPWRAEPQDEWLWANPDDIHFSLSVPPMVQEAQFSAAYESAGVEERARMLVALRALYDEQMLGVDRAIDGLMGALETRGLLDDTLIVLTADHGESFYDGEPVHLGHGAVLRHELVRVPLLFWGAGLVDTRVRCLAGNIDVFPTLLDAMGLPQMEGTAGSSMLAGCRDQAFSDAYEVMDGVEGIRFMGAESLRGQLIFDCVHHTATGFDLSVDPHARNPVALDGVPGGVDLAAALRAHFEEAKRAMPGLTCDVPL